MYSNRIYFSTKENSQNTISINFNGPLIPTCPKNFRHFPLTTTDPLIYIIPYIHSSNLFPLQSRPRTRNPAENETPTTALHRKILTERKCNGSNSGERGSSDGQRIHRGRESGQHTHAQLLNLRSFRRPRINVRGSISRHNFTCARRSRKFAQSWRGWFFLFKDDLPGNAVRVFGMKERRVREGVIDRVSVWLRVHFYKDLYIICPEWAFGKFRGQLKRSTRVLIKL